MMEFIIVTGLSGAGKSQAINALEDIGYYCIDNIPFELLETFFELCSHSTKKGKYVAGIDIRSFLKFGDSFEAKKRLMEKKHKFEILYLDCMDEIIITRYEQTRRIHPLLEVGQTKDLAEAVRAEREFISDIREISDYIVDTTKYTAAQLKEQMISIFAQANESGMRVELVSFGFKHIAPTDANLMFDVRCLPNPHYIDELKPLTGLDKRVPDYVFSFEESEGMYNHILSFISYSIPLYKHEGKSRLVIAIGCTGGRHRSVSFCERLSKELKESKIISIVNHRDINR